MYENTPETLQSLNWQKEAAVQQSLRSKEPVWLTVTMTVAVEAKKNVVSMGVACPAPCLHLDLDFQVTHFRKILKFTSFKQNKSISLGNATYSMIFDRDNTITPTTINRRC